MLVVVDQLPAWSFPAKLAASHDGFTRLARDGRRYLASYPYAATQTAPGHAALTTGAPPSVTGIFGNEWWDRAAGRELKATESADGGPPSAARLRVDGLADVLARARPRSRAIAIALKDRSALLSLGHAGLPIWYDDGCACLTTVGAAPAWLTALTVAHPIAPRLTPWTPRDPEHLAALSGSPDDAPGELAIEGWGPTFPHDPQTAPKPAKALTSMPLGNEILVEAAIAAIRGEHLGAHPAADLLIVSFSTHDYVGHAFGPDSWESWDTWLRLDAQLGDLMRALDTEVGAGGWTLLLTSDHGAPALPERRVAQGLPGRRIVYEDLAAIAEQAAATVAGPGHWIGAARFPTIYLTAAGQALPDANRAAVIDAIVAAIAAVPGIARADRTADRRGDCDRFTGDDRAICLSLDVERAGEVFYAPAAGTSLVKADWIDAVGHGSLNAYDREVPLLVLGPGIPAGTVSAPVSPLQVAPTLAALLGIPAPPAARAPPLRW